MQAEKLQANIMATSRIQENKRCRVCERPQSELPVSLRPCHTCRDAWYCSQAHRERDRTSHSCRRTVRNGPEFSRNCYILHHQNQQAPNAHPSVKVISATNKERLLSPFDARYDTATATYVLQTLRVWNAEVSHMLVPKAAPFQNATLRMMTASTAAATEVESYMALSYCWRPEEGAKGWEKAPVLPAYDIPDSDWRIPICEPMWRFLLDLRESKEEGIWIDQICINQRDTEEKPSAIASMDALYSSARLLFIALEDIRLTRHEAEVLCDAIERASHGREPTRQEVLESLGILQKLFGARWFSRAWCVHEYHMSRQKIIAVLCEGPSEGQSDVVMGICNLGDFRFSLEYYTANLPEYHELFEQMSAFFGGQSYAYSNIIGNTFRRKARHVRDMAAIALNVCRLPFMISPEAYGAIDLDGNRDADGNRNVAESRMCIHLLSLALAAGDVTSLTTRGEKMRIQPISGSSSKVQLATELSWVMYPAETSWSQRHDTPLREGISSVCPEYIELDLLSLERMQFHPRSQAAISHVKSFLRSAQAAGVVAACGHEPQDDAFDPALVSTLACLFDCGLEWTLQAWTIMRNQLIGEIDGHLPALMGEAPQCLEAFFTVIVPDDAQDAAFEMLLCAMVMGEFWDMSTCVRLPNGTAVAMCDLKIEGTEYVVPGPSELKMFGKDRRSHFAQDRTSLVVPKVLSESEFTLSDRVWLVERTGNVYAQPPVWRLLEKVCLLGCSDLSEDGTSVVSQKSQRVVG